MRQLALAGKSSVLAAAHNEDHLLLDVAHLSPLGYPLIYASIARVAALTSRSPA